MKPGTLIVTIPEPKLAVALNREGMPSEVILQDARQPFTLDWCKERRIEIPLEIVHSGWGRGSDLVQNAARSYYALRMLAMDVVVGMATLSQEGRPPLSQIVGVYSSVQLFEEDAARVYPTWKWEARWMPMSPPDPKNR